MKTENEIQEVKEPEVTKAPAMSPSAGAPNNDLIKWFVGVGASIFFIVLVIWTASLTLGVMDIVMPKNPAIKYFALALYDGGALVWLGMYAYKARGVPQHGISLLMFVVDFLGVALMTVGAIYLGGQQLTEIPAGMGGALVMGVIVSTLANVGAAYYYKLSDPEVRETIQAQTLEDTIGEEAMKQARATVEREARTLGQIMARRATARLKYRLSLPMTEQERAEWDGEVIEASAEDVPALPFSQRPTFWGYLKSFFGLGRFTPSPVTPQSVSSTEIDTPSPIPADLPAPEEPQL